MIEWYELNIKQSQTIYQIVTKPRKLGQAVSSYSP